MLELFLFDRNRERKGRRAGAVIVNAEGYVAVFVDHLRILRIFIIALRKVAFAVARTQGCR